MEIQARRAIIWAGIVLLLWLLLAPALPVRAADLWTRYIRRESDPGGGWVHLRYEIRATWCDNSGQCGTAWKPSNQRAVFERPPDREWRGHGVGDSTPPYPPVRSWPRLLCADGQWAAGYWYHNATFEGDWRLVNSWVSYDNAECQGDTPCRVQVWEEEWAAMVSDGSNFGPEDPNCLNSGGPGGPGGGAGGPTPTVPGPTCTPGGPTETPKPTRTPPQQAPTERPVVPLPPGWEEDRTWPPGLEAGYRPPNPVIVGQDPKMVGITLCLTITTWPIEHTEHWYTCDHPPAPDEHKCYEGTIKHHQRTTYIPDPPVLTQTYGLMSLTEESRAWIEGVLGPRFGVTIQHPDWPIPEYPGWPWKTFGPLGDRTFVASGCRNLKVKDPGWYEVELAVITSFGVEGAFAQNPLIPCTAFGITLIR